MVKWPSSTSYGIQYGAVALMKFYYLYKRIYLYSTGWKSQGGFFGAYRTIKTRDY